MALTVAEVSRHFLALALSKRGEVLRNFNH